VNENEYGEHIDINLTQKQLTHTVHIVFIYFTFPKVMKLHVQCHMSMWSMCVTDTQSNKNTLVLQCNHRLRLCTQHDRSVHDTFWQTDDLLQS